MLLGVSSAQAGCPAPKNLQPVRVVKVFDGDTVRLSDGRSVRLIGVNTPELNYEARSPEPGALAAMRFLANLQSQISHLSLGRQSKDHYGRSLGHLFLSDGRSVEELLLEKGLGHLVSIPPNLNRRQCLLAAEKRARSAGAGLWDKAYSGFVLPRMLEAGEHGFRLLRGEITRVTHAKHAWYLELDDRVALKISFSVARLLGRHNVQQLLGQHVEVRGWLIDRSSHSKNANKYKPWLVVISHPDHLQVLQ